MSVWHTPDRIANKTRRFDNVASTTGSPRPPIAKSADQFRINADAATDTSAVSTGINMALGPRRARTTSNVSRKTSKHKPRFPRRPADRHRNAGPYRHGCSEHRKEPHPPSEAAQWPHRRSHNERDDRCPVDWCQVDQPPAKRFRKLKRSPPQPIRRPRTRRQIREKAESRIGKRHAQQLTGPGPRIGSRAVAG